MNKAEFLSELKRALKGLPRDSISDKIEFFSEMIDDFIEEGITEEQAVAGIVDRIEDIANELIAEIPITKLIKEAVKPKKRLKRWEIALIIAGFPVWLPLLIAAFAVLLSLYVCIWAVDICLWAVFASFAGTAVGTAAMSVMHFVQGNVPVAVASIGAALICAGLSILSFIGCKAATKGIVLLTKKLVVAVKWLFVRKGDNDD